MTDENLMDSLPSEATRVFAPDLLAQRRCIITGGGTGIGLATARAFFALGARVALLGRREQVVQQAADDLDPDGERAYAHACDIRDPEAVATAVTAVCERFGGIDVLVNNAGGQFPAPAEAISPRGFEAVVRNNLLGTWNMTRAVATEAMIPQQGGVILNVIAQVERGFPGMAHTGAARAGVENLTRTLAIEWVHHGIRVNAIAPGYIRSSGLDQYPPELVAQVRHRTPMKRLGTSEEVAFANTFLCSDAARFITGITFYVDGGARLWGETWPIPDPETDD